MHPVILFLPTFDRERYESFTFLDSPGMLIFDVWDDLIVLTFGSVALITDVV